MAWEGATLPIRGRVHVALGANKRFRDKGPKTSPSPGFDPKIVGPFLPGSELTGTEDAGVSPIDICGIGVVIAPSELLVSHSGCPNQFFGARTMRDQTLPSRPRDLDVMS